MTILIEESRLREMLDEAARKGAEEALQAERSKKSASKSDAYARAVKMLKTWQSFDADSAEYKKIAQAIENVEPGQKYAGLLYVIYGQGGSFKNAAEKYGVSEWMIRNVHRRQVEKLAPRLVPDVVFSEIAEGRQ